jgi:single-strand DNA-binding protein
MVNKVILQGRLVRDPESFATTTGTSLCKFTLASNRKYKDREDTVFLDCTTFGKTAEACFRYLRKGGMCLVTGRLTTETWQDKNTGQERSKLAVTVEEVEFLLSSPQQYQQQQQKAPQPQWQQPPQYQPQPNADPQMQQAMNRMANQHQAEQQRNPPLDNDDIPF